MQFLNFRPEQPAAPPRFSPALLAGPHFKTELIRGGCPVTAPARKNGNNGNKQWQLQWKKTTAKQRNNRKRTRLPRYLPGGKWGDARLRLFNRLLFCHCLARIVFLGPFVAGDTLPQNQNSAYSHCVLGELPPALIVILFDWSLYARLHSPSPTLLLIVVSQSLLCAVAHTYMYIYIYSLTLLCIWLPNHSAPVLTPAALTPPRFRLFLEKPAEQNPLQTKFPRGTTTKQQNSDSTNKLTNK